MTDHAGHSGAHDAGVEISDELRSQSVSAPPSSDDKNMKEYIAELFIYAYDKAPSNLKKEEKLVSFKQFLEKIIQLSETKDKVHYSQTIDGETQKEAVKLEQELASGIMAIGRMDKDLKGFTSLRLKHEETRENSLWPDLNRYLKARGEDILNTPATKDEFIQTYLNAGDRSQKRFDVIRGKITTLRNELKTPNLGQTELDRLNEGLLLQQICEIFVYKENIIRISKGIAIAEPLIAEKKRVSDLAPAELRDKGGNVVYSTGCPGFLIPALSPDSPLFEGIAKKRSISPVTTNTLLTTAPVTLLRKNADIKAITRYVGQRRIDLSNNPEVLANDVYIAACTRYAAKRGLYDDNHGNLTGVFNPVNYHNMQRWGTNAEFEITDQADRLKQYAVDGKLMSEWNPKAPAGIFQNPNHNVRVVARVISWIIPIVGGAGFGGLAGAGIGGAIGGPPGAVLGGLMGAGGGGFVGGAVAYAANQSRLVKGVLAIVAAGLAFLTLAGGASYSIYKIFHKAPPKASPGSSMDSILHPNKQDKPKTDQKQKGSNKIDLSINEPLNKSNPWTSKAFVRNEVKVYNSDNKINGVIGGHTAELAKFAKESLNKSKEIG